jgi:septal ring factor EnvC (AmiA/AmiB activator)
VREDRIEERALLVELERAARALEETLVALGDSGGRKGKSLDGSGFEELRGALPPPVDAEVSRPFGKVVDAEYLTQTFRKGVEFDAPIGERVVAVATGEVRFAGWFRGYGKIVIMDHGDQYFTVSGHLSEIFVQVGDRVRAGDLLGSAGETGTLSGPSLYFELRHGSEPLDPSTWLALGRS